MDRDAVNMDATTFAIHFFLTRTYVGPLSVKELKEWQSERLLISVPGISGRAGSPAIQRRVWILCGFGVSYMVCPTW